KWLCGSGCLDLDGRSERSGLHGRLRGPRALLAPSAGAGEKLDHQLPREGLRLDG
ncbi:unnamed protein product, partial [Effrenium voratum]